MFSRASTSMALGGLGLAALTLATGCEGSSSSKPDARFIADAGQGGNPDIFVPPMTGPTDGGNLIEVMPPPPPPAINPAAVKVMPAGAQFIGGITVGCSYGTGTTTGRWCAFAKPGDELSKLELWVVNMSKLPPKCDGTDPNCLRVTRDLFGATPQQGARFPSAHRFYGDTLIFHADAKSNASQSYVGPIYAWAPGWPAAKRISSGDNAVRCVGHSRQPLAICLENLSTDAATPPTFDLYAGKIDGTNTVKKVARILPQHPTATMSSQWGAGFTADGKYFVYSTAIPPTPPATEQTPETLFYVETEKLVVDNVKGTQVGDPGLSVWDIHPESTKWFYMRDYNYSLQEPSGTLWMADFPTGANPVRLSSTLIKGGNKGGIATYDLAVTRDGKLGFLSLLQNYTAASATNPGSGDYRVIKNLAGSLDDKTNVLELLNGVPVMPGNSPDLRYGWYFLNVAQMGDTTDSRVVRNDKSADPCTLSGSPNSTIFGAPFFENAALAIWVDAVDNDTDTGAGMVADPANCSSKKKQFASKIDYWFPKGDEQLLFSDDVAKNRSTLKVAKLINGDLAPAETLQVQIDRIFAVLPTQEGVLFKITSSMESADGIYYLKLASSSPGDGGVVPPKDAGADAGDAK